MNADDADLRVSHIAAGIAVPARTRMLFSLMDGCARTSTELASIAEVSTSTASVHLAQLKEQHLVTAFAQGKHRYYNLHSKPVAVALESLMVVAGGPRGKFIPTTPARLHCARTCYDHMAGAVAVGLHQHILKSGWLLTTSTTADTYELSKEGAEAFEKLGIDVAGTRALRRRFAYACLDWSERKPHIGGALGTALLNATLTRKWIVRNLDSRALSVTRTGQRELSQFGIRL